MFVTRASIKKKIVTILLIAMNVIIFLIINVYYGSNIFILQNWAMYPEYIRLGNYYQIFTAMLVHADIWHLLFNMLALGIFGMLVENKYSIIQYLVIYFVSGLMGNIISLFVLPPNTFSLGASGSIFGVMAAYYISFTAYDKRMILYALGSTAFMVVLSIGVDVNSWAHLLGAIGGLLLGFIFSHYNKRKSQNKTQLALVNNEVYSDEDKWHYKPQNDEIEEYENEDNFDR